jgi:ribosome-associated heat shock protein Hsp15
MDERLRLDKWLWAARFYKTRNLAVQAIDGGRVEVNGERAKRAKALVVGDQVRVRHPPFETVLVVRALSERRGPATQAAKLYEETPDSARARAALAAQLRAAPPPVYEREGRPTKKDRREIDEWRRRS